MDLRFAHETGITMKADTIIADRRKSGTQTADDQQGFLKNLAAAMTKGELSLHYQPRYTLRTGKTAVLEALVRWQRPDVGLLYPETFVPAAETHGLIYQLDMWVFEQCCKDLIWMREHLDTSIRISVNISVLSCKSVYFSQKLIELCKKYELTLADFVLEITVSTHVHDIRQLKAFCNTLGNFGAEFCLDDFGTGQSPLLNLFELPVSSIVIDRALTQNIIEYERSEIIIKHLTALADELGIKTIAAGIEQSAQYKILTSIGCDQVQGHYMSRPVALDKLSPEMLTL